MTGLDQRLPGMTVKKKYSITGKMSVPTRTALSF